MAAAMDRVRSTFNNLFKSERYSRFTLQPAEEGERHIEVKLSDDGGDDTTEATTEGEGQAGGSSSFMPPPPCQSRRHIYFLALGILLIFVTGYLVGYISHRKAEPLSTEPVCTGPVSTGSPVPTAPPRLVPAPDLPLQWSGITQFLTQKLTSQAFDKTLRDFDLPRRSAGSVEDANLAIRIFDEFKQLDMDPWTDIHYVQLQTPDSNRPNRVLFGSDVFEPAGYLAYSKTGNVQGKLVYGNYGRGEDLDVLQQKDIELKDSVLLLRRGNISFAEQVDNAARKGASAVLIYPDAQDYNYQADTDLYGHVHLGSGDPYTPGFPSFNHTQFPPTQSSGLPKIPAQTITANMATKLLQNIGGPESDASGAFKGGLDSVSYRLGGVENVTVEVNNVLVNTKIRNVFGVIKGFIDPDRYVVLGAQRDAWGAGSARAAVGTSVLMELARAVSEMVKKERFRPRRSLVFATWSAGEYGNVGATEWLEAYMSSIDRSVFTYISLDGLVLGRGSFTASASPLLQTLIENTMKRVKSPDGTKTMYDMMGESKWKENTLKPLAMDDPAYTFVAFSGIPAVSFHYISPNTESYPFYGTNLDNMDHLNYQTNHRTSEMVAGAAQFAGLMALRLVHDHLISLDVSRYTAVINAASTQVYRHVNPLVQSGQLKGVSATWLSRARSSFNRAVASIGRSIDNSDLENQKSCRSINDGIMRVERNLLSPYVSPIETPFRHLLLGRGPHTLASIAETTDMEQLHIQLALATWNLQGCAYAMVRDIWDIEEEI